jgi:transposase
MNYYTRLQAFLLLDLRLSLSQVAEFVSLSLRTLYTWIHLFITKGVKALKPKSPKGRKAKLSKRQKQKKSMQSNTFPSS